MPLHTWKEDTYSRTSVTALSANAPSGVEGRELVGRQNNSIAQRTSPQVSFPGASPLLQVSTLTVHTFDCYLALNTTSFKESVSDHSTCLALTLHPSSVCVFLCISLVS